MSKLERLESTVLRSLTNILRKEVKDPALGFVTITEVRITNDLSIMKVYFTVLGDEKDTTMQALERSKPFIRNQIGKHVTMRKLPNIHFIYDESLEYGNRIEKGLKKVLKKDE